MALYIIFLYGGNAVLSLVAAFIIQGELSSQQSSCEIMY